MIGHLLDVLVLFFADRFSSCLVFILQPAPSRSHRTNTGISERQCSYAAVSSNEWVANTPVGLALARVDSFVQPYRRLRNRLVHAGALGGDVGHLLSIFSVAAKCGLAIVSTESHSSPFSVLRDRLVKTMNQSERELESHVVALLDGLVPVYEENSRGGDVDAASSVT